MDFEEIRPYNDEELPQIFEELIADPAFRRAAATVLPDVPFEGVAQKMRECKTKLDFPINNKRQLEQISENILLFLVA